MPKKLSTNPKAEAARERKADKKQQEKLRLEREKEDANWKDDDKQNAKKQQRKVKNNYNLLCIETHKFFNSGLVHISKEDNCIDA